MSLDDYVQVAVSMQFSDNIGKPFQPEENDSFVVQASFNGNTYEIVLGQPAHNAFTGKIVMRIRNGFNLSFISCSRAAMDNKWVIDDLNTLFGEHPTTNWCPDELNSLFNWAFRKYFMETKNNTADELPEWMMDGFVSPVPPTLQDNDFKAELEAQRLKEEEQEAQRYREEQVRLRQETQERLRIFKENEAKKEAEQQRLREIALAAEKARLEAEEKARLEAEEKARVEAEKKAREVKIAQSKKWYMLNLHNKKFARDQSFASQIFEKFNADEIKMLNNLFEDSHVGKETVKTWWEEFKNTQIDF